MSLLNSLYPSHITTWPDILVFFISEVITGLKLITIITRISHGLTLLSTWYTAHLKILAGLIVMLLH